jgi:cation:H+ antiporter
MNDYLVLAIGVVFAGAGGEAFVRGIVGAARWARVSPGIVGVTVVAFATSSPELAVSVTAALAGTPEISLGNVLGANVVNVAVILGLALCISSMLAPRESVRRDVPVALLVPVVIGVLALDGVVSRFDGVVLLAIFGAWMGVAISTAYRQRSTSTALAGAQRLRLALVLCVAGLGLLLGAGRLVVAGARGIAAAYGVSEFVIGATIVAVGTTIPELATTLVARLRGHDEVGIGNVLGSNIFNGLFIVAIAAVISPIVIDVRHLAVALIFGLLTVALILPGRDGVIQRWRGVVLLLAYGGYVAAILPR